MMDIHVPKFSGIEASARIRDMQEDPRRPRLGAYGCTFETRVDGRTRQLVGQLLIAARTA